MLLLLSIFVSCGDDYNEYDNENGGNNNITDVAVTGSVSNIERESAVIQGYVNFNLITITYDECEYGVEIDMDELKASSITGRSFYVIAKGLKPNTEYKYRTFVRVKDIVYYGTYSTFKTKTISNYLEDLNATNINFSSVRLNVVVNDSKMINDPDKEKFRYGWEISTDKELKKNIFSFYYEPTDTAVRSFVDSQNNLHIWEIIPRLKPETQYYYRAFIELNGNRGYTTTQSLVTSKIPFNIIDNGFVDLGLIWGCHVCGMLKTYQGILHGVKPIPKIQANTQLPVISIVIKKKVQANTTVICG
ncbi:MAG: hypothetical protein IJV10_01975 [Prevotella sp.]|nr:hypothetical protein [Prevotella sp.]